MQSYRKPRRPLTNVLAITLAAILAGGNFAAASDLNGRRSATPIQHIVVIFQENVSFDHYFGTYPHAMNPVGEPRFHARPGTPTVNGLSSALLTVNPNMNPGNGDGATNPFRLDRTQALTADQDHGYADEQKAFDKGLMDLFPVSIGTPGPPPGGAPVVSTKGLTMGFYDGNTVTALWNYAQHFAMSDNSYGTVFGPSTPGALNLISGQTNGTAATKNSLNGNEIDGGGGTLTVIGDPDPIGDICSSPSRGQVQMAGPNIGDLLSAAGVSWGWFEGGFDLTITNSNGTTGCGRSTTGRFSGVTSRDYSPHHQPFQYYASTANPAHARPASAAEIGHDGPANHQYDIQDFFTAVQAGNFPAVTFLKPIAAQDAHAGNSDPLDEQEFIVNTINFLQRTPEWESTAVVIMYDDSDGWYDHQMGPVVNQSTSPADALTGQGACGDGANALPGPAVLHAQGRCGYGPRLPLIVVSPWARENFVDHSVTDQSSAIRFIEDNWLGGQRIGQGSFDALANSLTQMFDFSRRGQPRNRGLFLDPVTGLPAGER